MGIYMKLNKPTKGQGPQLIVPLSIDRVTDKDARLVILNQFVASFDNTPFKGHLSVVFYQENHVLLALLSDSKASDNRARAYPQFCKKLQQDAETYGGPPARKKKWSI